MNAPAGNLRRFSPVAILDYGLLHRLCVFRLHVSLSDHSSLGHPQIQEAEGHTHLPAIKGQWLVRQ